MLEWVWYAWVPILVPAAYLLVLAARRFLAGETRSGVLAINRTPLTTTITRAAAPRYPPQHRRWRLWRGVTLLAAIAFVGAIWASLGLGHLAESATAKARTRMARATVLRVAHKEAEQQTCAVVAFSIDATRHTAELCRPGRTDVELEDAVRVAVDPGDPGNVEFADRSALDPGPGGWCSRRG